MGSAGRVLSRAVTNSSLETKAIAHLSKSKELIGSKQANYLSSCEKPIAWFVFLMPGVTLIHAQKTVSIYPGSKNLLWTNRVGYVDWVKLTDEVKKDIELAKKENYQASWILPRIVASCYPYSGFPTTRGWAEKQRLGDLPAYAKNAGSDQRQFANFDEEARLLVEGGETAKLLPSMNSRWFKIIYQPVTTSAVGRPIAISIKVSATSGVKIVRLLYRNVNQEMECQTLPMLPSGEKEIYQAVIPVEQINPKWDVMYLVEVMDNTGKGTIYPDFNKETPYRIVKLIR